MKLVWNIDETEEYNAEYTPMELHRVFLKLVNLDPQFYI